MTPTPPVELGERMWLEGHLPGREAKMIHTDQEGPLSALFPISPANNLSMWPLLATGRRSVSNDDCNTPNRVYMRILLNALFLVKGAALRATLEPFTE